MVVRLSASVEVSVRPYSSYVAVVSVVKEGVLPLYEVASWVMVTLPVVGAAPSVVDPS